MPRKIFGTVLARIAAFSLLLGACAAPAEPAPTPTETPAATQAAQILTFTDGLGRTVSLPAPAKKIVSLAASNTEILYAIGAGDQVVARDEFSDYPAEVLDQPSIGGSFGGYNNEAIVNLQPDLVLAAEINTPEQVQALESLGLTVFSLKNPSDLEEMYRNLLLVAAMTGHEAETAQLVDRLKARVARVEEKLQGVTERPLIFYELDATDPSAPYTAGAGTFIDTLINLAGGQNLGASLEGQYAQISLEELLVQDPDVILLGDAVWGGVTAESVASRTGWEKLRAVQDEQVHPFDDNLVSRPGPRLVDGLEAMARLLHPELFQ